MPITAIYYKRFLPYGFTVSLLLWIGFGISLRAQTRQKFSFQKRGGGETPGETTLTREIAIIGDLALGLAASSRVWHGVWGVKRNGNDRAFRFDSTFVFRLRFTRLSSASDVSRRSRFRVLSYSIGLAV